MKARVKCYKDLFDAVEDKDGFSVTLYGDDRNSLLHSVYALTVQYVVSNVYIEDSEKKEQNA